MAQYPQYPAVARGTRAAVSYVHLVLSVSIEVLMYRIYIYIYIYIYTYTYTYTYTDNTSNAYCIITIDEIKQMHESVMFIYNPQSCEAHTCLNISNSPRVNHYFQHIPHASLMVCIYIYQLYMYMYVRVSAQKM